MICVNNEHFSKAEYPIEVTEEGIVICVNNEHPEKAYDLIFLINDGIFEFFSVGFEKKSVSNNLLDDVELKTRNLFSMYSILFFSQGIIEILANFGQKENIP